MTTLHAVVAALIQGHPAIADAKGKIIVPCSVTTEWAVVRDCEIALTQSQLDRASLALRGIIPQAREWNWGKVKNKLDRAYRALGSENPGDGHDFHRGIHPVQAHL